MTYMTTTCKHSYDVGDNADIPSVLVDISYDWNFLSVTARSSMSLSKAVDVSSFSDSVHVTTTLPLLQDTDIRMCVCVRACVRA